MTKNNQKLCPNCQNPLNNQLKCKQCEYVAHDVKDMWKPANMGKQRGKPKANRDGK